MTKFPNPFANKESEEESLGTMTNSSNSSMVLDRPSVVPSQQNHNHNQHAQRRHSIASRRSSFDTATINNGVVLAKGEHYSGDTLSRTHSVNATFDEGVVMESGARGYLVVFGGFLVSFFFFLTICVTIKATFCDLASKSMHDRGYTERAIVLFAVPPSSQGIFVPPSFPLHCCAFLLLSWTRAPQK